MSASGPKRTCAGAAATLLVVGHAQQPGGIKRALMSAQETDPEGKAQFAGFTQGLAALGWIDGRNLKMEVRWGGGDVNRARNFPKNWSPYSRM